MEAYIRPLFCRGIGPFRWVALSGDTVDLAWLDDRAASMFPERPEVAAWIALARDHVAVQGLPARTCWLGHTERSRFAVEVNQAVASGELTAPVLFTRDHLDAAAMCHPHIGTEGMADGSDAISDWPILDALLLCSTGADLVAVHAGGGGYSGYMQSAGVTITADGTSAAAERLAHGFDADTGLGVLRHVDAGYTEAVDAAAVSGLDRTVGIKVEEEARREA
jgi:urocanate hydratase